SGTFEAGKLSAYSEVTLERFGRLRGGPMDGRSHQALMITPFAFGMFSPAKPASLMRTPGRSTPLPGTAMERFSLLVAPTTKSAFGILTRQRFSKRSVATQKR